MAAPCHVLDGYFLNRGIESVRSFKTVADSLGKLISGILKLWEYRRTYQVGVIHTLPM